MKRSECGIGDAMLPKVGKVWDGYSGRRLCVVVNGRISERLRGPIVGTILYGRVHAGREAGCVVATLDGRFLRAGVGGCILASVSDDEVLDGIDGPLLARFDGSVETGLAGAAFILAL